MSRSTISQFQLTERFPNVEAARIYLERLDSFVHNVTDRRITYNQLTAKAAQ